MNPIAFVSLAVLSAAPSPKAPAGGCAPGALVVRDGDAITAVDWVEYSSGHEHVHSVANQSLVGELDVELRADASVSRLDASRSIPGETTPQKPVTKSFDASTQPFIDREPAALEWLVRHAQALNKPKVTFTLDSITDASTREMTLEKLRPGAWHATLGARHYEIVADERGCLLAATLPEFGLVFERTELPRSAYVPYPPYGAPADGAYSANEVRIVAPEGHTLAGTLTLPAHAKAKLPAVVLITGISKHERNQGMPPLHHFRDIADVLSRAGIAVLRVDDRGAFASTGDWDNSTSLTEAKDVHTEIAWLRARPDIDPKRVAVVGLSEGGLIGPIVAGEDPTIAAVVTLAGPGVPGPYLYRFQTQIAVEHDPSIAPADREKEIAKEMEEPMTPRESLFMSIDPLTYAAKVRTPALIIQGTNDMHVPIESAEQLATTMREHGNRDVTVHLVPRTSHVFVPDFEGLASGWAHLPSYRVTNEVLTTLTAWLTVNLHP